MSLSVACFCCEAKFRAPDNAAGRTFPCPKCGTPISVKDATPQPPPPAPDAATLNGTSPASGRPSSFLVLVGCGVVGALLLAFGLTVGLLVYTSVKTTEQAKNKELASDPSAARAEPSRLLDERGLNGEAANAPKAAEEAPAETLPKTLAAMEKWSV